METNSVRKLYIDSRFRLDGSKSSSDMEFELNRAITLPRRCAGFVTDIHLMHSWYNVDEHAFRLYYVEYWVDNQTPHTNVKRISLPMKHYTATLLKNEIVSQLNDNKSIPNHTYSATYSADTGKLTVEMTRNNGSVWEVDLAANSRRLNHKHQLCVFGAFR